MAPALRSRASEPDVLPFPGVLLVNRFQVMDAFGAALDTPPGKRDRANLEGQWDRVLARGARAMRFRLVVTILLGFSVVATAIAGLLDLSQAVGTAGNPQARLAVQGLLDLLGIVQAVAGSAAAVLLVARLVLDHYLDVASTAAHLLAAQLAATPRATR